MEVVDTRAIVHERIDAVRQRVGVNRHQHIGIVLFGKACAREQIDRVRIGARQQHGRAALFQ